MCVLTAMLVMVVSTVELVLLLSECSGSFYSAILIPPLVKSFYCRIIKLLSCKQPSFHHYWTRSVKCGMCTQLNVTYQSERNKSYLHIAIWIGLKNNVVKKVRIKMTFIASHHLCSFLKHLQKVLFIHT